MRSRKVLYAIAVLVGIGFGGWLNPSLYADTARLTNLIITSFTLTNARALAVAVVDGSGNQVTGGFGGTQYAEGSVFSAGDIGTHALFRRCDTESAGTGVANGDRGIPCMDASGRLYAHVVPYNSSGVELVDNSVTEDAAEAGGEKAPVLLSVRRTAAATSAGATAEFATVNTDDLGLLWSRTLDPCSGVAKVAAPFSIATATTTQLVAASASNKVYVCSLNMVTAAANNVAVVEDDTSACASPTAGMAGGVTAATGWNFAANGGIALAGGNGAVLQTAAVNRYVCLMTSAATQLSGSIQYALAP